ncbi:MAG: Uncharacterised protein [Cyanobium sp. ARS6]|nr:MAG: Uncharacterised protein [Cyanobium sp. ARS6]
MDQVASEGPVALLNELGQFRQPISGSREPFHLTADHSHILWADGGRIGIGAAITSCEAETEGQAEAKGGHAAQGAQHRSSNEWWRL